MHEILTGILTGYGFVNRTAPILTGHFIRHAHNLEKFQSFEPFQKFQSLRFQC